MGLRKARTNDILAWMKTQRTKHVTYKLTYHFVWCPRYRKRILTGKIAAFVEQEIHGLCEANGWTLGALNLQKDHVHLFLSAPSAVAPSQIAHILKGATARSLFQRFVFREEAVMEWCVLVLFILCWEWGGYECGDRTQVYRMSTGLKVLSIAQRDLKTDPYSFGEDELSALEDVLGQFVGSLCATLRPSPAKEHDTEPPPVTGLHEA